MMSPTEMRGAVERIVSDLMIEGVGIYASPIIVEGQGRYRRVTWQPIQKTSERRFSREFGTVEDYHAWVANRDFAVALYDGSLLHVSYQFDRNDLIGHRLAYYPCPFDLDPEIIAEEALADVIDLYRESTSATLKLRGPIRFDCDLNAGTDEHPGVHLTLLSETCRIATTAPMSPGHFIRLVFRHFYPGVWDSVEAIRNAPQVSFNRAIRPLQEQHPFIDLGRGAASA